MANFTIYRSSAGSGKTYTLVKEYLKLVLVTNSPDVFRKILAITFTNKAASELKERIITQLQGLSGIDKDFSDENLRKNLCGELEIDENELKERSAEILQKMLYNYTDLAISTIDKFVVKILRYFNKELDVHPDFAVELNMKELLSMAIERVLSNIGRDKTVTEMSLSYAVQKSEGDKSWKIENDLNKIAKLLKEEESYQAVEILEKTEEKELLKKAQVLRAESKVIQKQLDEFRKKSIAILDANPEAEKGIIAYVPGYFRSIGFKNKRAVKYPSDSLIAKMEAEHWWPKKIVKNTGLTAEVDGLREQLYPIFKEALKLKVELLTKNIILNSFSPLIFSKRISAELERIKEEQNLVLLNDNNRMISEIVRNNPSPFIYEKLGEKYRHFLIDEFQDTSIVQWQNLIPLVEESLGLGNKNIIVGDSKQSIYRFRGGEMEQLAALPKVHRGEQQHKITEAVFENNLNEQILDFNYRSKKAVVEFNNDLFHFLLQNKSDKDKMLYRNHEQKVFKNQGGTVEMTIIDKAEDDLLLDEVVNAIKHTVDIGYSYGDIAILVYKNKTGSLIAEHCKSLNIPVVSNESLLLKNHKEVSFLMALIQHLIFPVSSDYRLEILKYLFNTIEQDLSLHEFLSKHIRRENFEEVFDSMNKSFDKKEFLQMDIYALAETLCKLFELNTSESYLLEFLNVCSSFARKDRGNTNAFIDYWKLNKDRLALQMMEESSAVNILSVHKSKGLEFPVVINPYYFKKFKKYSRDYLWAETESDVDSIQLIKTSDEGLETVYAPILEEEKQKTTIDQLNVLYVALTRATEILHILLPAPSGSALKENSSRLDCQLFRFGQQKFAEQENMIWGEFSPKREAKKGEDPIYWIKDYSRLDWRTELKIAISDELKGEELIFGNRLHDLLAEINEEEEIESVLAELQRKSIGPVVELDKLRMALEGVFSIKEFNDWHHFSNEVLNEKEILHGNGKILRPDKIFILPDSAIVVDFKTGAQRNSHEKQVEEYRDALELIGHENVKGYLLYTNTMTLKEVG